MNNDNIMKIIIAGGRNFNDYALLKSILDSLLKEQHFEVISGTAKGADSLGEIYAKENKLKIHYFKHDWSIGKSAGYLRNKDMAEFADGCICFWDGKSKGTKHMIDLAKEYNLKLKVINYE